MKNKPNSHEAVCYCYDCVCIYDAGSLHRNSAETKIPGATYMGGNNTITEICKELDSAGAAHVDIFREWAVDFADSAGKMQSWKIHGQILGK